MRENIPVYIQIHDAIKEKIEENYWEIGDRLPSERELAIQFEVSRMTLRQAIQMLADEGIVERKIGSGTYVSSKKVQEKMTGTTSFSEIMRSQGRVPTSKAVSYFFTTPSSSEIEKLNLKPSDSILRMERIRLADGVPICFEVTSIPKKFIRGLSKSQVTSSLYQVLEENGHYKITGANQTVSAMLASEKVAEYLEIKRGSAVLRVRQVSFLDTGEPFEYVRSQYVGNRFEFILEK